MLSNSSHTLVVPSGAACFVGSPQAGDLTSSPCPVTSDMLQFLNLTMDFGAYFGAYCLNPPQGDGCPYGYCPNSEIAGILSCPFSLRYSTDSLKGLFVRIAAYMTNFFVGKYLVSILRHCLRIQSMQPFSRSGLLPTRGSQGDVLVTAVERVFTFVDLCGLIIPTTTHTDPRHPRHRYRWLPTDGVHLHIRPQINLGTRPSSLSSSRTWQNDPEVHRAHRHGLLDRTVHLHYLAFASLTFSTRVL